MAKRAQLRRPLPRLDTLTIEELVALRKKHPEENTQLCERIYRLESASQRSDGQAQERFRCMQDSRERLSSVFSSYRNSKWIVRHKDLARICRTTLLATERRAVLMHWVRAGLLTEAAVNEQLPEDVPEHKSAPKNGRRT